MAAASDSFRLPTDVQPIHYDVTIRTDLEKLTFDGFVKIDLDVKKETSQIVFNSSALNLGNASLQSDSLQTELVETSRTHNKDQERTTLHFPKPIPAGSKAQLQIAFDGELTGSMMGYYRSSYEVDGKKKYYTLTQFEPTAARRAFPCWDEPLLKATFAITLISREGTVNLSNMPAASEKPYSTTDSDSSNTGVVSALSKWLSALTFTNTSAGDKWKITKFETTPKVSTYLVAYANGPFEYLESSYVSPISKKTRPLRIYATADHIGQAQFALDVKAKVLPIYEEVFDVEYPLPKLDTLIAADFDAGAMENWGLITGRTSVYCLDPERPSIAAKKRVATVQSHEVAHQWFGNVVTMAWWDNLYLNEGFATLMGEVVIPDKVFPEWRVASEFITDHLNDALRLDAKLSSHPIEVECPDANQVNQIFDSLSYAKAGSVLRMLSEYVGEDVFLKGVSIYLKKRLYGNSVSRDLWEGVSEAAGYNVTSMMETWVGKMGFPVLTVTEVEGGIKVRQDRYLESGPAEEKDNQTIWTVPLRIVTVGEDGKPTIDKKAVLDTREKTFSVDTSKPYKLNANTTGVYRVIYPAERVKKIGAEFVKENSAFTLDDRIGTVHDIWALAKSGHAATSDALSLVDLLRQESEYLVWSALADNVSSIPSIWFENEKVISQINAFRRSLAVPLVKKLGWKYEEGESVDIAQLRTRAISVAAAAGDQSVIDELQRLFTEYQRTNDESVIPADLVHITLSSAVKYGGRDAYEVVKKIQEKPKNPAQRIAAIQALCSSEDPAVARETFEYAMKVARDQDFVYFFGIGSNIKTRRVAGEYFKENYDAIYKRFEGNFSLKYFVERAFGGLASNKDYEDVKAFFKDKDVSKFKMSLEQTLDGIQARTAYIKRSTADLEKWLDAWEKKNAQ